MVKVCSLTSFPKDSESKYKEYFDKFKYSLHIFQKWAIEAIVEGDHVLVTAPTGSGKTVPAEFALDYFHSIGKKTIYCSPIKALSNEKFYNFTQKYPHISIGLITGDIKTNPDADVLIMTTEILLNKLYQIKSNSKIPSSDISFDMNIESELGCVIFDEIHMINDENRGTVWENSIMLLPRHVQMIGLSATLDNPEKFAYWLENRGDSKSESKGKIVYLTSKKDRAVPLTHYSFITVTQGIFKAIKDKSVQAEINAMINKPFILQDAKGKFNDEHYFKMKKMLALFEQHNVISKRSHVLNQVAKYLTENEMTPAICYIFSIKKLEMCAKETTANLLEFDSKIPYTVKRECEQILRSKLTNFEEYLLLPEYLNLVSLLEKGIATHHSKMLPVLREIVELLFAKGYVKILYCTETMSVGINLPVKTTIFTDVNKFDGNNNRLLYSHEYTQASGRAGRLGIDTIGHVFHLNNLFKNVDSVSYKLMMNGKPQTLTSKFKISFNLLLNLIDTGDSNIVDFAKKSMVTGDLDSQMNEIYYKMSSLNSELDNMKSSSAHLRTPIKMVEEYINLQNKKNVSVNKKRKEIERQIQQIQESYKYLEQDKHALQKIVTKEKEIFDLQQQFDQVDCYIQSGVKKVLTLLSNEKYIETESIVDNVSNNVDKIKLTFKGTMATHLREVHCLIFARLLEDKRLNDLSSKQLVSFFSCFTNINISDDLKDHTPKTEDKKVKELVIKVSELYSEYQNKEIQYNINSGSEYNIHYDLLNYVEKWCNCENAGECKLLLQQLEREKDIFLGEFVKALLKINNISNEMEKIAELIGNIEFLSKLREIPVMTMKYVVTNQSLYV